MLWRNTMSEQNNAGVLNGAELKGMENYRSLMDVFHEAVQRFADKPAFSCMGQTLTFTELDRLSADFAAWLQHETELQPRSEERRVGKEWRSRSASAHRHRNRRMMSAPILA